MCVRYSSVGVVSTLVPCLWVRLVVIKGDGQQYRQVGLSALGLLTVLRNCKRYYPRGMKTALSGSVREDRQVKTDDARPNDCTIILVPCYTCSCKEPWVATSGRAYLMPEGWGLGGQRVETCQNRPNNGLLAWGPKPWFLLLFCPRQVFKMTPHRKVDGFYFSIYNIWLASVYGSWGYPCDDASEISKGEQTAFTVKEDVIIWNLWQ